MTTDCVPKPNPLAAALLVHHAEQLNDVLEYVDCTAEGSSGIGGIDRDRTARNSECKRVWVNVNAGFSVDITGDIARQVIAGLEKQAGTLDEDAAQLRAAVALGKFAK